MAQINIPSNENLNDCLLDQKNIFLLIGSFGFGLLFNFMFFEKPLGVSYPLYIVAMYIFLFWNLKKKPALKLDFTGLLGITIFALSLTYLFFSNPIFQVLNFLMIPVLFVAHTLLLTSNNRHNWFETQFLLDLIHGLSARLLGNSLKPFLIIAMNAKKRTKLGKYSIAGKVLVGLILTIPLLFVIVPLLASADDVFRYSLEQIPNLFKNIDLGQFFPQLFIVTVITCLLFSYLWSILNPKPASTQLTSISGLLTPRAFLDPITVTTLLILINALYVFFIGIQFSYLFGSLTQGLPQDFTYAEYARKGFFELVSVTFINLIILIANLNFVKGSGKKIDKVVKILNTTLVGCTFIMLLSAHFRMSLYEEAYGFTYLRILTHAFMGYLCVLFAVSCAKIWRSTIPLLKAFIIISLVSYTLLNYTNIDRLIAKNNIERYNQGASIDISHLTTLSYDAVPLLVDFKNTTNNQELSNKLDAALVQKNDSLARSKTWQSFNISKFWASNALSE